MRGPSPIKGAGGSEIDFHFLVVSDRGECQLSGTFYGMKNIFPSQSYRNFQISKIYTITVRARNLIAIPRKSTLKSISSHTFRDRALKLCFYVLGTKTIRLCDQNFDLGIRSENIKC